MKPRRYTYASECDKEQLTPDEEYACKFHRYNRLKLKTIPISHPQTKRNVTCVKFVKLHVPWAYHVQTWKKALCVPM